jgi:hypothetical protein
MTVRIDDFTVGKYICRASVKGFREISATAEILMKGPPRVLNSEGVQFGRIGSNVELTCDAFAIPPPTTILWSNYGFSVPINGASGHYSLVERPRKDGFRSTLIIRNAIMSDFGNYNCSVQNSHGIDSFVVSLKEESEYV